jgi:lipopolysaccharide assembly protein A
MHIVRWAVGATLFLALVFLSLQNSDPAELRFFNLASFRAPLVVVVFVAFAVGVAIGLLTGALRAARLRRQVSRLRRENHARRDPGAVATGGAVPGTSPASGPGYDRVDRLHPGV